MLPEPVIPEPALPRHLAGYGLPTSKDELLTWDFVAGQMSEARYYWLSTTGADGSCHAAPVWGLWFRNRIHFDGSPRTRWARNLLGNPNIAVHTTSAEQVVIIEGTAHVIDDDEIDDATWRELDDAYRAKYDVREGSPYWVVHPRKVIAWDDPSLKRMTRWLFS